jgi:EmrB/QacA subfamily drug resistance transporter
LLSRVPYKWLVAIAFVAGFFMDLMDVTIVNVAIPTLSKQLNAPNTKLEWVVTGYLLSLAIWIPASGWLGDRFGTKRIFLFALAMFTLGSILCSLAPTVGWLIIFRVFQGVGGGMMTPVGIAMLFRAFPPDERAQASSIVSIVAAAAPAIGPVLGGYLSEYIGWRWIFLVNVPIGIFAFLFASRVLREYKAEEAEKFDYAGFFLSAAGLVLLLYAFSNVPTYGPWSPNVLITGNAGLLLLALLVWVESRLKSPILHFKLFKDRLFRTANVVMFFAFSLWIGSLFILPLFLQQLLGLTAFQSGLTTAPQAIGWITMSTVASRIYHRLGPKIMVVCGLTGATVMTLVFITVNPGTNLWLIRVVLFFRGLLMAFAVIPIQAAIFTNISPKETGHASSIFNTNRQVASSFGTAILGTVLFELLLANPNNAADQLFAYHVAFAAAGALGLIGIMYGLTIRNKDAEASFKTKKVPIPGE